MNVIEFLKSSNNNFLKHEANDYAKWFKLKHTKKDLELFLNFNIAQIDFINKEQKQLSIIGTSNTALIKIFNSKKEEQKKKYQNFKSQGLESKDPSYVYIWDLIENKQKSIYMKSWQIINFISISRENILILDQLFRDFLKK